MDQMNKEPASSNAISEAALKVCSREELIQMPKPQRSSLMHLIARRLDKEGIKELVTDHLWHPALNQLSRLSPGSATTS